MECPWAIHKKKQTGRVEDILFWNPPWNFSFFLLYPWKFQAKQSFTPGKSKNFFRSLGNSKAKNQDPWKFHIIFSWSNLGSSTSFLIKSWKFNTLSLWYPCNFYILNHYCLVFLWNSPSFMCSIGQTFFFQKSRR